eukprot:2174083-Pyramimonas_sp.AAC.1
MRRSFETSGWSCGGSAGAGGGGRRAEPGACPLGVADPEPLWQRRHRRASEGRRHDPRPDGHHRSGDAAGAAER